MMPYFVAYEIRRPGKSPLKSNVILRKTHPVIWAANPPEIFVKSGLSNVLLFYAEISPEVVDKVAKINWCGVEI